MKSFYIGLLALWYPVCMVSEDITLIITLQKEAFMAVLCLSVFQLVQKKEKEMKKRKILIINTTKVWNVICKEFNSPRIRCIMSVWPKYEIGTVPGI